MKRCVIFLLFLIILLIIGGQTSYEKNKRKNLIQTELNTSNSKIKELKTSNTIKKENNVYKDFYFNNPQKDKLASKILYDYLYNNIDYNTRGIDTFTEDNTYAYFVDLNGNGINEVIGVMFSTNYYCDAGWSLFILEKDNSNKYKEIDGLFHIEPVEPVIILNTKTNNYKDIIFTGGLRYNFKQFHVKYQLDKDLNTYYYNFIF